TCSHCSSPSSSPHFVPLSTLHYQTSNPISGCQFNSASRKNGFDSTSKVLYDELGKVNNPVTGEVHSISPSIKNYGLTKLSRIHMRFGFSFSVFYRPLSSRLLEGGLFSWQEETKTH